MDALEFIRTDHTRIRNLFLLLRGTDEMSEKKEAFDKLRDELDRHSHSEETLFYPSVSKFREAKDMIEEFYDDHQEFSELMEDISEIEVGSSEEEDEEIEEDLEELMDTVEFHIEREERELFPIIRQRMDASELQRLGALMAQDREKPIAA